MDKSKEFRLYLAQINGAIKVDEINEAVKINSKVRIHAPGKHYHGEVGRVGEIRHGLYKGAPKTYTVDYGDRKSIQLGKENIRLVKDANN